MGEWYATQDVGRPSDTGFGRDDRGAGARVLRFEGQEAEIAGPGPYPGAQGQTNGVRAPYMRLKFFWIGAVAVGLRDALVLVDGVPGLRGVG
jgi:hypothetical protein